MADANQIRTESPEANRAALLHGKIVLIDVREPAEYGSERIHGALLFPLSTFDPAMLHRGNRAMVLHCGSGKRSAAFKLCADAGVAVRSHLDGGIAAWKAGRLPIVSVDPAAGAIRDRV